MLVGLKLSRDTSFNFSSVIGGTKARAVGRVSSSAVLCGFFTTQFRGMPVVLCFSYTFWGFFLAVFLLTALIFLLEWFTAVTSVYALQHHVLRDPNLLFIQIGSFEKRDQIQAAARTVEGPKAT